VSRTALPFSYLHERHRLCVQRLLKFAIAVTILAFAHYSTPNVVHFPCERSKILRGVWYENLEVVA